MSYGEIRQLVYSILVTIFMVAGYGILVWVDWRIAVGVFLIHWSIAAESGQRKEHEWWWTLTSPPWRKD